jgi:hypothetical protein
MPTFQAAQRVHTVVLVGDFNPKIFQPAWFGAQELIQSAEVESAKIDIVHSEVVIFTLDWLRLEITRDRFSAGTQQEPFEEVVRDLVVGTFRTLRHTPLRMLGINQEAHFRLDSEDRWHAIGHALAPKAIFWEGLIDKPGTASLTVTGPRPDGIKGQVSVTVEPSRIFHPGLYIRVNDHFDCGGGSEYAPGADKIIDILESCWVESRKRSSNIFEHLMEQGTRC